MEKFLNAAGWRDASQAAITSDWSPRRFWRLTKPDGNTAVLLQGPVPEIAGHGLPDFITFSERLRGLGLSAPAILAHDLAHNFLLIEDFGVTPIDTPSVEAHAYGTAIDVLAAFRTDSGHGLTHYKDGYIYKKLALYSDAPAWLSAWAEAEAALPTCPYVFAHMDYKAGNLHWLPERAGVKRIGILDFQAAQLAPFTYDIVNLLEDARRNIAPDLKAALKARFKTALPDDWKPLFDDWYVFMAAQFHARVLGQIHGKSNVAPDVQPRLEAYLETELKHPALAPVAKWLEKSI